MAKIDNQVSKTNLYTDLVVSYCDEFNDYSLWDTKRGAWVTFNGRTPYMPCGGKAALEEIVRDGGLIGIPKVILLYGKQVIEVSNSFTSNDFATL